MSHRRYKQGTHRKYDSILRRLRLESELLNGGNKSATMATLNRVDKTHLEYIKTQLIGENGGGTVKDEAREIPSYHGIYRDEEKETYLATIPLIEKQLKQLERQFEAENQIRINTGVKPMEEMPSYLLEEKVTMEAKLDLYKEELDEVERLLSEMDKKQEKIHNEKIKNLKPIGIKKLKGGIVSIIDGQNVSITIEGFLIINDPASPYHGVFVDDYSEYVVKPYQAEKRKKEELYQKTGKRQGNPKLPKLPKDCPNYYQSKDKKFPGKGKIPLKKKSVKKETKQIPLG